MVALKPVVHHFPYFSYELTFFRHTTILCHIMPHCLICQRHGNRWNKPVQPLSSVGRLHVSHCYQLPSGVGASFLVGDMHMEPGMVRIIWKMRIFVSHVKLDKHVPKLGKWLETAWKVTGHQSILRIPGSFPTALHQWHVRNWKHEPKPPVVGFITGESRLTLFDTGWGPH